MAHGITFERDGSVARITLDRPEVGNALTIPMARELMETAIRCEGDAGIRCVLLTGSGKLFCAGGDIVGFSGAGDALPDYLREITTYVHAAVMAFVRMDKPVVVAVNGPAAGGGIGFALVGDIVLAEPAAHFTLAYTAIGMSPDCGATWLLPKLVGLRRAQELCLTNRRVGAEEAAAMGMITRVVEAGTLADEANKVTAELVNGATSALGATRRLLLESSANSLEAHLDLESRLISAQARTAEGREGVSAFVAKRPPRYV